MAAGAPKINVSELSDDHFSRCSLYVHRQDPHSQEVFRQYGTTPGVRIIWIDDPATPPPHFLTGVPTLQEKEDLYEGSRAFQKLEEVKSTTIQPARTVRSGFLGTDHSCQDFNNFGHALPEHTPDIPPVEESFGDDSKKIKEGEIERFMQMRAQSITKSRSRMQAHRGMG